MAQYLIFDTSWNPYFVQEANNLAELVRQSISRSGDLLTDRFRPVLKALKIEIQPRPTNWFSTSIYYFPWVIAFLLAATVIVVFVVMIINIATAILVYLAAIMLYLLKHT
jgi:hypothetical protein